jgi:hypothetical protein
MDQNGAVNLDDFEILLGCLNGPQSLPSDSCPPAMISDFDGDGDADLYDLREFLIHFAP